MKQLLQISNDFPDQKIYVNLVKNLSILGYHQIVYVPVKWENKLNGNKDDSIKNVEYHYSYILKRNLIFRLRYKNKLNIILRDIENKINLDKVGLVHAHFLFSDGGVAYLLKKKYNIPYVVSVRASDIHTFFSKMLHLKEYGNKIMMEAERVVFINHSYIEIFKKKYLLNNYKSIITKIIVIPNAIDDKWFISKRKNYKPTKQIKILFVGRIIKRKNLTLVIKAIRTLNKIDDRNFQLEVVGDGNYLENVKKISDNSITFHGQIKNFNELLEIYNQCHIFAMPSVKETFGLVYIEAMSQGLPVIYCKNEAIDGFFKPNTVGYPVTPNSVQSIVEAVCSILENYETISSNALNSSKTFNWKEITKQYDEIYSKILCKN